MVTSPPRQAQPGSTLRRSCRGADRVSREPSRPLSDTTALVDAGAAGQEVDIHDKGDSREEVTTTQANGLTRNCPNVAANMAVLPCNPHMLHDVGTSE